MNPNLKNMVKEAFCERKQREPGHGENKREAVTEMETDTQREKTNEYYEDKNALQHKLEATVIDFYSCT